MITLTDEDGIRFELDPNLIEEAYRTRRGTLLKMYGSAPIRVLESIDTVTSLSVQDQINSSLEVLNGD